MEEIHFKEVMFKDKKKDYNFSLTELEDLGVFNPNLYCKEEL